MPLLASILLGDPQETRGKDRLEARFEIGGGQFRIPQLAIESPAGAVAMRGAINFDSSLDLQLAFDPSGGIPGQIWVLGSIFRSLSSKIARFKVRGTLSSPVMVFTPFGSAAGLK
jgi:hypothetical protein